MADGDRPEAYLAELVERARGVLAANLVGAYAAGSVGLDAYQPGRSDIDVALVTAEPVADPTKRALVEVLRHEALPVPARGLELVVYTRAAAASGTSEPAFEVELNTGPAMAFRATYDPADRPSPDGRFWYALDRSILSGSTGSLLGPPANEAFVDVVPDDLRDLLVEALTWWLRQPGDPADAVLGACRSLVRVRDGSGCPRSRRESGCSRPATSVRPWSARRSPDASARGHRRRARRPGRSSAPSARRSRGRPDLGPGLSGRKSGRCRPHPRVARPQVQRATFLPPQAFTFARLRSARPSRRRPAFGVARSAR